MHRPPTSPVARRAALSTAVTAILVVPPPGGLPHAVADGGDEPPAVLPLTGIVRDFREWHVDDGHVDFDAYGREGRWLGCGYGIYAGNVAERLGPDGKPVFTGNGFRVNRQWEDAHGRPICYTLYEPARGDRRGGRVCYDPGGIDSGHSFDQWYRDVMGVNLSAPLTLAFVRQPDGTYVFDDKDDPRYADLDGFFPIDDRLFGNSPHRSGGDHNYHFTFELHTEFVYRAADNPVFRFLGDDDVWVFIDGRKVIDLGGVHSAREQVVDLRRLDLTDGEVYPLSLFFAERNRVASNFRAVTNLVLASREIPAVTAAFD